MILRGLIVKIVQSAQKIYQNYSVQGRPDELSMGKLFQHHGFKSQPNVGDEIIHLQEGNNGFAVAENDNNLLGKTLVAGDVYVYGDSKNYIKLIPDASGSTTISIVGSQKISIQNTNGTIIMDTDGSVNVNAGTYYLVTKSFIDTVYSSHVHPYVNGTTPATTSAPVVIVDPNQVTSTFKAK